MELLYDVEHLDVETQYKLRNAFSVVDINGVEHIHAEITYVTTEEVDKYGMKELGAGVYVKSGLRYNDKSAIWDRVVGYCMTEDDRDSSSIFDEITYVKVIHYYDDDTDDYEVIQNVGDRITRCKLLRKIKCGEMCLTTAGPGERINIVYWFGDTLHEVTVVDNTRILAESWSTFTYDSDPVILSIIDGKNYTGEFHKCELEAGEKLDFKKWYEEQNS